MNLEGITWQGQSVGNSFEAHFLPRPIDNLLQQINGFILWEGALHVRGVCIEPEWHSLQSAMDILEHYHVLEEGDVPFAQDCVGDQFIFRENEIYRLLAETGELEKIADKLLSF